MISTAGVGNGHYKRRELPIHGAQVDDITTPVHFTYAPRRGEGGRAGYAPHYAERNHRLGTATGPTPERNHRLGTATGPLPVHEAPRFGRLRLPQLGAGVSRNGSVERRTPTMAAYFYGHYNLGT